MSREVDERIVRLEFDNKDFEKRAKKSSSTLEKLKSKMDFRREARSMDEAFNEKRFDVFLSGLDKVKVGFSKLEIAAASAISNITNRVVDAGIKMAKSLSTDNIKGAWASMDSINETTAALIAQGQAEEDVAKTLKKLKWFSDETSYSFEDLTKQMNNFVSVGMSMEEAANVVMGVSGMAAMNSKKAADAIHVLNQLSQSAGTYIKKEDWVSVRTAGLSSATLINKILEAAADKEIGTINQLMDGTYITKKGQVLNEKTFESLLTEGQFFTGEVLKKVTEEYARGANEIFNEVEASGDLTYQVMERLGKRMDEDFSLVVFGMLQKTRSFSQAIEATQVAVKGSWTQIFQTIFGDEKEATTLWSDLAERLIMAFTGPFEKWFDLLDKWNKAGGRDDLFGDGGALWNLIDAFERLKQVVKDAWNEVFHFELDLKGFTEWLKNFTSGLILSDEAAETLKSILKGLFSVLKLVGEAAKLVWELIKLAWPYIRKVIMAITDFLAYLGDSISNAAKSGTLSSTEKFFEGVKNLFEGIWAALKSILPTLEKILEFFGEKLSQIGGTLKKIFTGEQGLFEVKDLLTLTVWAALIAFFWWMGSSFIGWSQTMKEFVQGMTTLLEGWGTQKYAKALKMFATSILMIVAAIAIVGSMDPQVLTRGMIVIGIIWAALLATLDSIKDMVIKGPNRKNNNNILKVAGSAVLLALSMLPFAGVIAIFGSMPTGMLTKGTIAVVTIIGVVALLSSKFAAFNKDKGLGIGHNSSNIKKLAGNIALIGLALIPMALAIATLGIIPLPAMIKGGIAAVVIIGVISLLSSKLGSTMGIGGNSAKLMAMAGAMALIGLAMLPMALAILTLGSIPSSKLKQGAIAVSVIVGIMAVLSVALGYFAGYALAGVGIIALLGVALIPLSAGLVVFAVALAAIAGVMVLLSKIDFNSVMKGIGIVLLVSLAIAAASALLSGAAVILLIFAAAALVAQLAFLTFAAALNVMGVGLLVIAAGLAAVGGSLVAFINAISELSEINFGKVAKGMLMLIAVMTIFALLAPLIILLAGACAMFGLALLPIIKLIELMSGSVKKSADEIKDSISKIADVITHIFKVLVEKILEFILFLAGKLTEYVIPIGAKVIEFILSVLDLLTEKAPDIAERLVVFIFTLITSLADAIGNNSSLIVSAVQHLVAAILAVIFKFFGIDSVGYEYIVGWFENIGSAAGDSFGYAFLHALFPWLWLIDGIKAWFETENNRPRSIEGMLTQGPGVTPVVSGNANNGFYGPFIDEPSINPNTFIDSSASQGGYSFANIYVQTYDSNEAAIKIAEELNKNRVRTDVAYGN